MRADILKIAQDINKCCFDDKQAKKMKLEKVQKWLIKHQDLFSLCEQKGLSSAWNKAYEIQHKKPFDPNIPGFIEEV